jgi:predicted enzyme involved in methoxymalonyl-ACP biosynthesis
VRTLRASYIPTKKNAMVADHYARLGFENTGGHVETGETHWTLDIRSYTDQNTHINVLSSVPA